MQDVSQAVKDHIAKHTAMAPRHEEQTKRIASHFKGSIAAIGPIKSHKQALEKVQNDYKGDHNQLTDVIRSTVVARDAHQLKEVVAHMKTHPNMHSYKEHKKKDNYGYSGHLFKMNYPGGVVGEIQANTPHVIYAKEKEHDARGILGHSKYEETKDKLKMKGGQGHHYYEKIRDPKTPEHEREELKGRHQRYYDEINKRA